MTTKKRLIRQMMTFICGVTLVACGQAPTVQTSSEYEVMRITTSDKELQTTYSASIRGRQDIDIYPQVSGFLTKLCVEEGQAVRKGQVLFFIDQVPYRAALQTAEANVEAARASVATAQLTYDSKKELFAQNVISEFDLQTSYNNLLTAKAQLAQTEAQRVSAANNLSYTEVKSPADGVVGTLPYRVGALVSASLPKPLTTVSDNSDMYVYFSMTENQLLDMTRRYGSRSKALEEMPAIGLILNDKSTYPSQGKIETISGVIDQATGAVSVRAAFNNPQYLLRSGGTGSIQIPSVMEEALLIPQKASYELQDKKFVYVVQADSTLKNTEIQVFNLDDGKNYVVTAGLNPGDQVVIEGVGTLRDGQRIKPITPQESAAKISAMTQKQGEAEKK